MSFFFYKKKGNFVVNFMLMDLLESSVFSTASYSRRGNEPVDCIS